MGRDVVDVVNQLLTEWATPREPAYLWEAKVALEMPEQCSAERARRPLSLEDCIPADLREFWGTFFSADLFRDVTYGQWGLRLLDYETSNRRTRELNRERPEETRRGDRVIGEFIGDADLLLVRCDPHEPDFGSILVAIGEGWRSEWYPVGDTLSAFLEEYAAYEGQKYWEPQFRGSKGPSTPAT